MPPGKIEYLIVDKMERELHDGEGNWGIFDVTHVKLQSMHIPAYTKRLSLRKPLLFAYANDAEVTLYSSHCEVNNCTFSQFETNVDKDLVRYWI